MIPDPELDKALGVLGQALAQINANLATHNAIQSALALVRSRLSQPPETPNGDS